MEIGDRRNVVYALLLTILMLFGTASCGDNDHSFNLALPNEPELNSLRVELPCTGAGVPGINCPTIVDDVNSDELLGDANASYDVTIRVRGVVEQKTYIGSTDVDGLWAKGGTPDADSWNIYKLHISSPDQTYYLNYGASDIDRCWALDHQINLIINDGAIVELSADSGGDDTQTLNQDDVGNPIVIPDIPPAPAAFDGQFVQMDVISIVKR